MESEPGREYNQECEGSCVRRRDVDFPEATRGIQRAPCIDVAYAMKLVLLFGLSHVVYDVSRGEVVGKSTGDPCGGLLVVLGGQTLALYPGLGTVFAQVREQIFDLQCPDVGLRYEHHPDELTTVILSDATQRWEHSYEAWWKGSEYDFTQVRAIPELSEEAEEVLFIGRLIREPHERARFIAQWERSS